MSKDMSFGWRANTNADGFERTHGRFTMEVFWDGGNRDMPWVWLVWTRSMNDGKPDQMIVKKGEEPTLDEAKKAVIAHASKLERKAIAEDQKFR